MARNIEIKARVADLSELRSRVVPLATDGPFDIAQDDAFFKCDNGRLKLRTFAPDHAELIFYRRADDSGPKESYYLRSTTADPDGLRQALTLAYGQTGRVIKRRTVFLIGRTRVHLDRVEGLGEFIELEVVLADDEAAEAGTLEAHALMATLRIRPADLIEGAYLDLLKARR